MEGLAEAEQGIWEARMVSPVPMMVGLKLLKVLPSWIMEGSMAVQVEGPAGARPVQWSMPDMLLGSQRLVFSAPKRSSKATVSM